MQNQLKASSSNAFSRFNQPHPPKRPMTGEAGPAQTKGPRDLAHLKTQGSMIFFARGCCRGVQSGPPMVFQIPPSPAAPLTGGRVTVFLTSSWPVMRLPLVEVEVPLTGGRDAPMIYFPQYKLWEVGAKNACLRPPTAGHLSGSACLKIRSGPPPPLDTTTALHNRA